MGKDDALLKQYEIMVGTTQNVTTWRQTANTFYLTINTALLSLILYTAQTSITGEKIILSAIGIILAVLWFYSIDYYKKLNKAKFDVIWLMEEKLPMQMFKLEYKGDKEKDKVEGYRGRVKGITVIEKYLPVVFGVAYVITLVIFFV